MTSKTATETPSRTHRIGRGLVTLAVVGGLALVGGCEFFDNNDEADLGADELDTGTSDDGGDPPPSRGFRVFPKFMLIDVPAIVTIDLDGVSATACPVDAIDGGYLCDASDLQDGSLATLEVVRDGFDTALRHPEVQFAQIVDLEVHLAVEGGPSGVWSECTPALDWDSCDAVCAANFMDACSPTSCSTDDPEWPLASFETYTDADCLQLEASAVTCDAVPGAQAVSARCCCG